jgi:hypothetical protein
MNMTKKIVTLFRIAGVVTIGFIAIGLCLNGAEARGKSGAGVADTGGRTASSYRKPIKLSGIGHHRRGHSGLLKGRGGMPATNGGLKSAPTQ